MNTAQTIFTLFYGLYFATTIPMAGMFRPFDTPAMYGRDGRSWARFFASFLLLDLVPLAYFVFAYRLLKGVSRFDSGTDLSYSAMVVLFLMSIPGFGFWRIYFGMMLLRLRGTYVFYGPNLPPSLLEELQRRSARQHEVLPHVVPGVLWVAGTLLLGWYWSRA